MKDGVEFLIEIVSIFVILEIIQYILKHNLNAIFVSKDLMTTFTAAVICSIIVFYIRHRIAEK